MLVSSKLIRNGTALERPKLLSKRRRHCQEARTWDDQSATQTVNLGSLFRGGFLDPISCISYVIVLILGPENVPKIGPKSSGERVFVLCVSENLVHYFCTAVRLVGDNGSPSGRPFIHESLHHSAPGRRQDLRLFLKGRIAAVTHVFVFSNRSHDL